MPNTIAISAPDASVMSAETRRTFAMWTRDARRGARPATDWLFDCRQAAGHTSGSVPANGAALGAGGIVNLGRDSHQALPAGLRGADEPRDDLA